MSSFRQQLRRIPGLRAAYLHWQLYKRLIYRPIAALSFFQDLRRFQELASQQGTAGRFRLSALDLYPCFGQKTSHTTFDEHYVYHTAWAARVLQKLNPVKHVDVSSTLQFSALLSAFFPIDVYEYRPFEIELDGLESKAASLENLPFASGSIASLSCMHVVEHAGLGRYGDPIDPNGDVQAFQELRRVLAPGGTLLMVLPTGGVAKVQYNAHRIYTYQQVLDYFPDCDLREFALVVDRPTETLDAQGKRVVRSRGLIRHATAAQANLQDYGCGCYWFVKK